jgi:hypothetical protein
VGLHHLDLRRRGSPNGFLEPSIADIRLTAITYVSIYGTPVIGFIIYRKVASFDLFLDVVESQLSCFD